MKLTVPMFVRATKMHSWEKGYNAEFPFKFYTDESDSNSQHSWVVHKFYLEMDFIPPNRDQMTQIQIKGLEQCIVESEAAAYRRVTELRDEIQKLLALPATIEQKVDFINVPDSEHEAAHALEDFNPVDEFIETFGEEEPEENAGVEGDDAPDEIDEEEEHPADEGRDTPHFDMGTGEDRSSYE